MDALNGTREHERDGTVGFRVIAATGIVAFYVAVCLAALSLVVGMWAPSL